MALLERTASGRVPRHVLRGGIQASAADVKRAEDAACRAGLRNPGNMWRAWPGLWSTMAPVADLIAARRGQEPRLQGLAGACGVAPARPPPPEECLLPLRRALAGLLGLSAAAAEQRHAASTWRSELVRAVQRQSEDPDEAVADWLLEGAPMGIRREVRPGGLFPAAVSEASLDPAELLERAVDLGNHPSFYERHGQVRPPGVEKVQGLVDQGFGILFEDRAAAESYFSAPVFPAPLGNISREKPDGTTKHRVIQDLKANLVNSAVTLAERQVLPTIVDHALDVALLSARAQGGDVTWTLVLDFADAFMSVPLHPDEQPFNCAHVGHRLRRSRPAIYPQEALEGGFVVWRVLGFGGKPNPVVFGRVASFAARTAQALLRPFARSEAGHAAAAPGRLQLYVDDPVLTVTGEPAAAQLAIDLVLTWWLLLGVPLAWKKGALYERDHQWIGARFVLNAPGEVHVFLPPGFLADLFELLEPFVAGTGHASLAAARRVVGKCARVAYVVPDAAPFAAALWGALGGAAAAGREAPPGRVACRRFGGAAMWMRALFDPAGLDLLPHPARRPRLGRSPAAGRRRGEVRCVAVGRRRGALPARHPGGVLCRRVDARRLQPL